ncbi:TerB family tellurite resistance protein [Alphaproteobacteria bacterium]|nr:TerB family tellurite resistance protein [Alphaproteobacteria bacterium]
MEIIFGLVVLFFGGAILRAIFAGGKAAVTGQSFGESYRGIPDFKVKLIDDETKTEGGQSFDVKRIALKGLIPIVRRTDLTAFVSVIDITDDESPMPVLSFVDAIQEENTNCFLQTQPMGNFNEGVGFTDWVNVGAIIPTFIQTAESGERELRVIFTLANSNNPPEFEGGIITNFKECEIIVLESFEFSYDFEQKGYMEASRDEEAARGIAVQIAMAVAMSDGSFDDSEGIAIKEWVEKTISSFSEKRKKELKSLYNEAIKKSYKLAKKGNLSLSDLTNQLNDIDDGKIKYDTMNLCYQVMAADGVATDEELKTIRLIGESLQLDMDELAKMRDKEMIGISSGSQVESSLEEIIGIDPTWDKDRVKRHLSSEFGKWSGRLNALTEGPEREHAQMMLERIATARKKYVS